VESSNDTITAVGGIRVGHAVSQVGSTGCTVILFDNTATGGISLRGAATGTRQIDSLSPTHSVQAVNGVCLVGGSAFGMDAAGGVLRHLAEKGIGYNFGAGPIPIIPTAVIFDLFYTGLVGDPERPDLEFGRRAADCASAEPVQTGSVGAGAGATVGKLFGIGCACKGGLGSAAEFGPEGLVVGALAVVNAFGDVIDDSGAVIAGVRQGTDSSRFAIATDCLNDGFVRQPPSASNTTLVVVATNAGFSKVEMTRIAGVASNGLRKSIRPVGTLYDGDCVFAFSGGKLQASEMTVSFLAERAVARAIRQGIHAVESDPVLPFATEIADLNLGK
jgi:L-aminopeptidase/D-esterase-like protein